MGVVTMARLTLAFSNSLPQPQRTETPRFGSPNRPGLALVRADTDDSPALKLFSAYLRRERRVSEHTVVNYLNDVRQLEQWLELSGRCLEAGRSLERASRDDVQAYVVERMAKGLSAKAAQRKLFALRSFYRLLLDEELMSDSTKRGVYLTYAL